MKIVKVGGGVCAVQASWWQRWPASNEDGGCVVEVSGGDYIL